jgi:hypothetical protein
MSDEMASPPPAPESEDGIPAAEAVSLRQIALDFAAAHDHPRPSSIAAVGAGRLRALRLVDPHFFVRGADEASHLIVMTGQFGEDTAGGQPDAAASAESVLWLIVTAESHVIEDWGTASHAPDLASLGTVLDLSSP